MSKTEELSTEESFHLPPLPKDWAWKNLSEIGLARLGKTPRKSDYRDIGLHKIVKFRDVDEFGQVDWDNANKGYVDSAQEVLRTLKELKAGDILVTASAHMSEHIGKKVGLVRNIPEKFEAAYVVGEILQIRANDEIDPKWILYYLRSSQGYKAIQRRVHGVHLIASRAQNIEIPVAPPSQQKRIVAEIEKQFSRLDEAVTNLKRVKANLKRYKAAVLKAAVEGRLVETEAELARREGRDYETGEQLLQRILEVRRSQWKGKGKYKEPATPDTTDLPELPEGWVWVTVGSLLADIQAGKSFKCEERPPKEGEIGVVKVSSVTWGEFDESESKTCLDKRLVNEKLMIQEGDFLFSRANTIELVGACVIAKKVTSKVMLSDKILRFRLLGRLEQWVLYNLRSVFGRDEIERLATGNQESMRNIGQDRIRAIRIPLPPMDECKRIISEVDRRLSLLAETEAQVEANLQRAERLRQSILAAAFSGRIHRKYEFKEEVIKFNKVL